MSYYNVDQVSLTDYTSLSKLRQLPNPPKNQSAQPISSMDAIYVSNIPTNNLSTLPSTPPTASSSANSPSTTTQQQQQQFDENGQPIKVKKKPGRKPNPASPALRKAQNRAAQRAFRERKERHLKDLEGTIRQLREQRNKALKELNTTKSKMDAFRAENWYLKGVVLTLQFVCLHHNIHIPTHSPYLTEEDLSDMARTTPHAIEAYVNAYTKNNENLKPTMAAHFANSTIHQHASPSPPPHQHRSTSDSSNEIDEENNDNVDEDDEDDDMLSVERESTRSVSVSMDQDSDAIVMKQKAKASSLSIATDELLVNNPSNASKKDSEEKTREEMQKPSAADNEKSLSAIQHIRLQLRLQSAISSFGSKPSLRLQPTILQLAIPHDPRIDLIPTPHMRDRMIIFRDQMDYDRCFAMLLNGALYHGGDPTMSASWELPPEFFSEFWYLAINYDVSRTNKWRRMKGLPEINVKSTLHSQEHQQPTTATTDCTAMNMFWQHQLLPQQQQESQAQTEEHRSSLQSQQQQHVSLETDLDMASATNQPQADNALWPESTTADDIFSQFTEGMPSLQPLDATHLASGFDFGSPNLPSASISSIWDHQGFHMNRINHTTTTSASADLESTTTTTTTTAAAAQQQQQQQSMFQSVNPIFDYFIGSPTLSPTSPPSSSVEAALIQQQQQEDRSPSFVTMMELMNTLSTSMPSS